METFITVLAWIGGICLAASAIAIAIAILTRKDN